MSEKANENNQILFNKPHSLHIGKYIYLYKDELKNKFFSYRCKNRKNYGLCIKIEKTEL